MQHMGYSSLEDLNLPRNYPSGSFTEDAGTVLTWENPAGEHRQCLNNPARYQASGIQNAWTKHRLHSQACETKLEEISF